MTFKTFIGNVICSTLEQEKKILINDVPVDWLSISCLQNNGLLSTVKLYKDTVFIYAEQKIGGTLTRNILICVSFTKCISEIINWKRILVNSHRLLTNLNKLVSTVNWFKHSIYFSSAPSEKKFNQRVKRNL